jgi:mRNA interferase HigB
MGTHIFARSTLRAFWEKHADTEGPLKVWHASIETGDFQSTEDVLKYFSNARSIGNSRVIFNILGNQYRLVVQFRFNLGRVFVCFIGTHAEYDAVDATTI